MKKEVVIINGSGGVGKDTFVSFCAMYTKIVNISTVDEVKKAAKLLGWNGGKTEDDRKFLSDLKLLASDYNSHSYEYARKEIEFFRGRDTIHNILFIHVREPEEIDTLKRDFDCKTLLVRNKNKAIITSNMADANVEKYEYDYKIDNDSDLDHLKRLALGFVGLLGLLK